MIIIGLSFILFFPEICLDDPGIRGYFLRLSFGNFHTMVKHNNVIRKVHHGLHNVLDHKNRDAPGADLLNDFHHLKGFAGY